MIDFTNNDFASSAIMLRRWEDGVKVVGLKVPALEAYREEVEHCFQINS